MFLQINDPSNVFTMNFTHSKIVERRKNSQNMPDCPAPKNSIQIIKEENWENQNFD